MEQWEKDLNGRFGKSRRTKEITGIEIHRFVKDLLKKERSRNVLIEIIDYVKKSKSNTDILYQYVLNNSTCQTRVVHTDLCHELGIAPGSKEDVILSILEKHFNPPKETGT